MISCIQLLPQVFDFPNLLLKQIGVVEINKHKIKKNGRGALPLVAVWAAIHLAAITVFLIYFAFCLIQFNSILYSHYTRYLQKCT